MIPRDPFLSTVKLPFFNVFCLFFFLWRHSIHRSLSVPWLSFHPIIIIHTLGMSSKCFLLKLWVMHLFTSFLLAVNTYPKQPNSCLWKFDCEGQSLIHFWLWSVIINSSKIEKFSSQPCSLTSYQHQQNLSNRKFQFSCFPCS